MKKTTKAILVATRYHRKLSADDRSKAAAHYNQLRARGIKLGLTFYPGLGRKIIQIKQV